MTNIGNGGVVGFKYFDILDVTRITVELRGYAAGEFSVRTAWDGEKLGSVSFGYENIWKKYSMDVRIPNGTQALYFTYEGGGSVSFRSFLLE